MAQSPITLDNLIADVFEATGVEGTVYRNGDESALILLEDRIITVNAHGTIAQASIGEWDTVEPG